MFSIDFTLPLRLKRKANHWVATCPALDITTQGNNEQEAKTNLIEATRLFLSTCIEKGTIDDVLKGRGVTFIRKTAIVKGEGQYAKRNQYTVSLPFNTRIKSECHA